MGVCPRSAQGRAVPDTPSAATLGRASFGDRPSSFSPGALSPRLAGRGQDEREGRASGARAPPAGQGEKAAGELEN